MQRSKICRSNSYNFSVPDFNNSAGTPPTPLDVLLFKDLILILTTYTTIITPENVSNTLVTSLLIGSRGYKAL